MSLYVKISQLHFLKLIENQLHEKTNTGLRGQYDSPIHIGHIVDIQRLDKFNLECVNEHCYFSPKHVFWQHTRIVSSGDDSGALPKHVFDQK